jgi:uncharacterized protein YtpQ (UPF0354 family)
MLPNFLKTFVHPHSAYRLEYPAHWDQMIEKNGESCGFGPHDRDDVGLWISILPVSLDTDRLADVLPNMMRDLLPRFEADNLRVDPTLRHYGLVADMKKEGQGGHYWILAGGDLVLLASSQVPVAERDVWNPPFQKLMASLQITRDQQLQDVKVANEVLQKLRQRYPDQNFAFDEGKIRGTRQVVYLSNLYREVRSSPSRRDKIIERFVETLGHPEAAEVGHETWQEAGGRILPMLKPREYVHPDSPTQHLFTSEWLGDVIICYVIRSKKLFRFVTGWDVQRWGIDAPTLHQKAMENLAALPWPRQLVGSRTRTGRVIVVDTADNLAASRLLHPELHSLFSKVLGNPFWAGIPHRDGLILFSDRRELKQRIGRQLRKDHDTSAYPITPDPFLVTADGIAPPLKKK